MRSKKGIKMNRSVFFPKFVCVCGRIHRDILFKKFKNKMKADLPYLWWAMCPTKAEPILMKVIE